jgi:hypothetical protein
MALSLSLNPQQGLTFNSGSQQPTGHLLSATLCGTALTADLTVTDPVAGSSRSGPACSPRSPGRRAPETLSS